MFMVLHRRLLSIPMFICPRTSHSCQKYVFQRPLTEFTQRCNNPVISAHVTESPFSELPPWIPAGSSGINFVKVCVWTIRTFSISSVNILKVKKQIANDSKPKKTLNPPLFFHVHHHPCLAWISFPFACSFPVLHFPAMLSNMQRTGLSLPHQHQHFTALFPQLLRKDSV